MNLSPDTKVRYEVERITDRRRLPSPTHGLPFAKASRGVLVHRVRSITVYAIHASPHAAFHYWCNMTGSYSYDGSSTSPVTMMAEPEGGQLVCHRCEAMAVAAGEKPSDELVGRHVHKGRVRPQQTCCRSDHE